jgi:hypothetical protein
MREYGLAGFSPFPAFRIFGPDSNPYSAGGQFQVWPTPGNPGNTLVFEYQWKNIFLPKNWTPSTAYTSGELVFASGNIYECTTNGTSATVAPTGRSLTPVANGTTAFKWYPQAYESVLQSTDNSAFDPEVVIAGFKAWYFETKVQPQAPGARAQFDEMIGAAKRRFTGSFRGSMSRRYSVVNGISPQGGWAI